MKLKTLVLLCLSSCLTASVLFAASVTNEGKTAVKLGGKTKSGTLASMTINPGQTLPIRQPVLWIEHITDGANEDVNIKVLENDGRSGWITTPGGRYDFAQQPEKPQASPGVKKPAIPLQAGYAKNNGNIQIFLTVSKQGGQTVNHRVMPGQTVTIPEDTVEVKLGSLGSNRGNEEVFLLIVMPDGKQHIVRSPKTTIRTSS
jgi:hypothetical protein